MEAIEAGVDLLLYCADLDRAESAVERLTATANRDERFATRLSRAAEKVDVISRLWPAPSADLARFERAREQLRDFSA